MNEKTIKKHPRPANTQTSLPGNPSSLIEVFAVRAAKSYLPIPIILKFRENKFLNCLTYNVSPRNRSCHG